MYRGLTRTSVLFLLIPVVVLTAAHCRSKEQPKLTQVMVWRHVGTWSGQASVQTDSFISETGVFRVRWESRSAGAPDTGTLRVTLHSAISGRPLLVGVDQHGTGQNMAYMNEDPREFFLVIDASGVTWNVSLEEGLRALAPSPPSH